ncbi:helix-turn-helix transcriptional regulator [Paenibacillus thermoaerophilus]|uniref:Helix-turn-helix transcriptional regulator n=1 Tax=Paenibacillus thermoaerophilus TaxID=1215385 RepID=A0ABW2V9I9_9BACL|nr:metalloregulator ArsR/SmtB family transcription factor [Paenibacillus thermoaerophilus]TMV17884.1 transcriptional regulator [Paenibacillus thermoaerophilus]
MNGEKDLSTRETILQLLKTKGELSTKDLTGMLGITVMAVRRHLNALERDGLIRPKTVRLPMGRPAAVYSLTEHAEGFFPKKYHTLTLDLLGELAAESGDSMVELLFERRKESLKRRYEANIEGKPLTDKVAALADIQNDNGYMVEWERTENGDFLLKEHNCPISVIANQYRHACRCELELFQSLLDADVDRTECLAEGGRKCVYVIRSRGDSPPE